MAVNETIVVDTTKKTKSSYNVKGATKVNIITEGSGNDFVDGIESVTASGSTLTIKPTGKKAIKFKNISNTNELYVTATGTDSKEYYNKTAQAFFDEAKFTAQRKWLSKPSATKVTGSVFDEIIDLSGKDVYTPTSKNLKKRTGVTVNAGGGNDTITGTLYNDTLTGGAGADTFVFNKTCGVDTIKDATKDDVIKITDSTVTPADLTYRKNGNNLEIMFDYNNKIIVQNHFKKAEADRIDSLVINNSDPVKISEQVVIQTVKGKYMGADGDDKIFSGSSNDNITGGKGTNTVIFSGNFGKDTVNLTEGENLVLDMSGYPDLYDGHVKRVISGNNLVLKVYNENNKLYGQVTLKDFAKANVVGDKGSVILRLVDGDIDLNKTELDVRGVKSSYKGSRFDEYIEADFAKKAITITGGQGDDYIVGNLNYSSKSMTFAFSEGDGHDRVDNTKANDVIQINSVGEVTYANAGSDLIIGYGSGDTIQVTGYYLAKDTERIDTLKVKKADGTYETVSLADKSDIDEYKKTVKEVRINDGEINLPADTEYTTLNFVGYSGFTNIDTYGPEYGWDGKNDNDLYMSYGNQGDMIIFKDFFKNKGAHNTKYIIVGGKTYELPRRYFTTANDNITAPATEDWLYLSGGDHKVTFTENNYFHLYDYIMSEGAGYKDTLVLDDYSFRDGEIEIGRETGTNGSLTIKANDGEEDGRRNNILYRHYFDGNTPLVNIVDKNGTIVMDRTFATATKNWSTDAESGKDHVLFVNNNGNDETTTTITSNTRKNLTIVDAYAKIVDGVGYGKAKLNYNYVGGDDVIYSSDSFANDTYNVNNFTAASRLSVIDGGGQNDVVKINANSDDFYLLFDVYADTSEDVPNPDDWATGLVHKEAMTAETVKEFFSYANYNDTEHTIAGVLKFNGANYVEWNDEFDIYECAAGSTIEYLRTNDNNNRLDVLAWKKYIAGRVDNWLENNSSVEGKNLKFYYGSIVNVMRAVESDDPAKKITLTDAQYESLKECFKVKYSELPQNGEFVSTTGNDTYNLKEANNSITFNNAVLGKDTIVSPEKEYNASYRDRIFFTGDANYSVKNGTLDVKVSGNDLVIGKTGDLENNSVTYKNYVNDENHNLVILNDGAGDKYFLETITSGGGANDKKNHIAFVYNNEYPQSVGYGTGRNYIYSYGEKEYIDDKGNDIKGMWSCLYRGGIDTVVSYSTTGSDGYEVWAFDKNSQLYVSDAGGAKDSLRWGEDDKNNSYLSDARFIFNVNPDGTIDYSDDIMFVHKDALSGTTLNSAVKNDLTAGVLKYDMASSGTAFGLEKVTYGEYNPETRERENVDMTAWTNAIVENVQGWLTSHSTYTDAYDAFEKCNDVEALNALVGCYNVDYTTLNS